MPTVSAQSLHQLVTDLFAAAGTPDDIAQLVAKSLVESDLVGHDSHGVVRVRQYLDAMRAGDLTADARPNIIRDNGAVFTVDARRGFGQLAAGFTMQNAIARAKEHGIASAALVNCGHVGRLGEWVEMAAAEDAIALAFCTGGGAKGIVTPFGGAQRVLGTNPMAASLPLGEEHAPMVLDFATSAVAEGKVRVARNRGKSIPEGWVLNSQGLPTTDPNDLYDNGMLLPFATYKGYALSLMVELLSGVLTGNGTPVLPGYKPGNGVLFIVMDVAAYRPVEDYQEVSGQVAAQIKAVPPAPGYSEVLLPGEPEQRMLAQRMVTGVTLDDTTWTLLSEDAALLGVDLPAPA